MSLPSFTVVGSVNDILEDVDTDSELVTRSLSSALVTFTPNISQNQFVTWAGELFRVNPVTAQVTTTGLSRSGLPVKLLANDAGLDVDGLQWTVSVVSKNSRGMPREMRKFTFDAPTDGATVNLADVVEVPSADIVPFSKGDPGDPVDGVSRVGNTLVFTVNGTDIGDPVDISDLGGTWDTIAGKPTVIAAGSTQAAARAAIGLDLVDLDEWEWFDAQADFPASGVTDVVYGARDSGFFYRWNGTDYVQVGGGGDIDGGTP